MVLGLLRDDMWGGLSVIVTLLLAAVTVFLQRRKDQQRQSDEEHQGDEGTEQQKTEQRNIRAGMFQTYPVSKTLLLTGIFCMFLGFTLRSDPLGEGGLFLVIVGLIYRLIFRG